MASGKYLGNTLLPNEANPSPKYLVPVQYPPEPAHPVRLDLEALMVAVDA